ncbi:putative bifunctional diguanylate cyclase/phosphodiesterase [Microvirga flavescens]|uniref:putative bifunctional diguanylate cyclase/phosphodiesterase n=1 Tax=Microvirga flavescens TaxID=2249811 RepID=UPI000DD872E8|nr:EAL domain-containing protein [Microvirga flavescens]
MSDTVTQSLSPIGGEFKDPGCEAVFQAERLPEKFRHIRLLFILSALLNTLFLISDWRFYGEPHFQVAFSARLTVIAIALACYFAARRATGFCQAERVMLAWEWINAIAVGFLVSSHSDLALLVVLMLPSIYYLAVPTSFRWSVASGIGCSAIMLFGYVWPEGDKSDLVGLILAMVMLNLALILVVSRSNRLGRLEWLALQAERRAKNELAESRAMFESLFRTVPLPLVVVREDGSFINFNDAAVAFFGATSQMLGIQSVREFYANPEDRDNFLSILHKEGRTVDFETTVRTADGSLRNVLIAGTKFKTGGETYIISALVDITDRKAAEERVWRAASHDPLTDLPNRALFQGRFEQALAEAQHNSHSLALLLIDLDDFKSINDALGHDAGDAFLQEMARRLRKLVSKDDTVARLGGDEFVVILHSDATPEGTLSFVKTMLEELRRPFLFKSENISGRASVGIAIYPEHDTRPSELLKDADLALYSAKAKGRNRAAIYSPEMRDTIERKVTLVREIQDAVTQNLIVPYYQPKVNLFTGDIIGFEALARWDHPTQGLLAPISFAAAFEDPELSIAVGEHMIRRVAEDIRAWREQGIMCGRIAVNLSTAQFNWVGLARRFLEIVQRAGVDPKQMEIEITETVFLGRSSLHVATVLKQFHDSGVRIALDDFGTGYASLIHLKQFPVDDIKIDQSFIRDVEHDTESAAIVNAVLELGKSLEMDVIAEGVETEGQAEFLREHGCLYAQGNLYAHPMPASEVAPFLVRGLKVAV